MFRAMNGTELKNWREAKGLTQADLGRLLGKSRESVVAYEKSDKPVPKAVELACGALTLGMKVFKGGPVTLNQYRLEPWLVEGVEMETLATLTGRSMPAPKGVLRKWLEEEGRGVQLDQNDIFALMEPSNLALEIRMTWNVK